MGDAAIDDHCVGGVGRGTARGLRGGDHRITAFTLAPSWPTGGRAKDCFAASSLGSSRRDRMAHGRVAITQLSSGYLSRDSTIQLVKVPYRPIIDVLRYGHAPIRNHLIKSIDPTPT